MDNWDEINEFLQPKMSPYCPEAPSLTQRVFLRSNSLEALFGGSAGGGKSSALLMAALQYVDVPGYSAILFRRTFSDLALPGALMDRFINWMGNHPDVSWNGTKFMATFPSGAKITFGYLNNKADYLRYKGAEFQFVGMDEVTEIRQEDYEYLFSRMRRPKSGPLSNVPLRMRAASNPAPNWVRQRFIVEGKSKGRIFVPSSLDDNPGIDHESYRRSLQQLSTTERQMLEFGDWWVTSTGNTFKREDLVIIQHDDIPTFLHDPKYVRFWDMAGSDVTEENPNPDWTVGVLAMYEKGILYILDVKRARVSGAALENLISSTAQEDSIHVPVRMEQEPGSAGKTLINQFSRHVLPGFDLDGIRSSGDKYTRAKPLAAAVQHGNVKLLMGEWNNDFIDELSSFSKDSKGHDDQVDAASSAFAFVADIGGDPRRKVRIIV